MMVSTELNLEQELCLDPWYFSFNSMIPGIPLIQGERKKKKKKTIPIPDQD